MINKESKELLDIYVKKAGFKNMRQFCMKLGISQANLYSNLNSKYSISIGRMFKIANLIGCQIDTVIEIFYPNEYEINQKIVMTNLLGEEVI